MANSAIGSRLGRAAMVDRFARGNSKLCMFKVQTSHRHRSAILCRPNSLASAKHEQKDATQRISFAPMDADRLKRLAHLAGIPLPRIARLAGMAGNGGQATARRPHHQRGDPQQVPPSGKGSAFSIRARDGTSTRSMEPSMPSRCSLADILRFIQLPLSNASSSLAPQSFYRGHNRDHSHIHNHS
jgi:hypothetical protein